LNSLQGPGAQPGFFLRGWAEVMEAKSIEKEKMLVIRIAKESA